MRQWFRIEEPEADAATVAGRPVLNIDPKEGLFIDEEGNSYRLAGGNQAKPLYAEVIPVEGGPETRLEAGTNGAPMSIKQRGGQRGGNGLPVTGRRRRKGGKKRDAIPDELSSRSCWPLQRGRELERPARRAYEQQVGIQMEPLCLVHDQLEWMRASLDGLSFDGSVLEIKCP